MSEVENPMRIENEPKLFSLDEIGEIVRNKRNLLYLLELNGFVIRLLSS